MENTRVTESKSTRKMAAGTTKKTAGVKATSSAKSANAKRPIAKTIADQPAKKKPSAATSTKTKPKAKATQPVTTASPAALAFKPDSFQDLIEQTAYYMAECRGFQGGDPSQDWATSEKLVENIFRRIMAYLPNQR